MNTVELNEMLKDTLYLSKLNNYLKEKGLTIEQASKEDLYHFINQEEQGKTDYYTGQPTPVNYSAGLNKIEDLIFTYRNMKVIIKNLLENEVL